MEMHKLTECLEQWADQKLHLIYWPNLNQPYDKKLYRPINKISFYFDRVLTIKDLFKNPLPHLIDTIELADNYLVRLPDLKRLKYKWFGVARNSIILDKIYYDRWDHRIDIVVRFLDKKETKDLNLDLETTSKHKKTLEARKDVYLYWLFDEEE